MSRAYSEIKYNCFTEQVEFWVDTPTDTGMFSKLYWLGEVR